ncbi:DUF2231 domain-containing protein [Ruixingdingia sedimenti]|uniref:DUF2231 domain-containing protein n=1 Tax=Ruixingdingia sedimenti TaxID=3073604 RepID=A0ABU1F3L8_9RHOB|nr:DUF2231 domain-containing protein [Xinfangfangia sp. LG-4]MDR5651453.1 DUF2231 domain-containing protein [Xinfangfangia sp. LG-4]
MPPRPTPRPRRRFRDPIHEHAAFHLKESRIAIAGHPVHAMLVTFPIALCICTFGADLVYWLTGDPFWPRVALWAAGVGFGMGVLAGVTGTAELLLVPGIRIRAASWTHFILAVMLLSLLGANWGLRLADPQGAVLPWGLLTSGLAAVMTGMTGWHGGKLVFDYGLGTQNDHGDTARGAKN